MDLLNSPLNERLEEGRARARDIQGTLESLTARGVDRPKPLCIFHD
jgi:hypothetical protein